MAALRPPGLSKADIAALTGTQLGSLVSRSISLDTSAAATAALNKIRRIRSDQDYEDTVRSTTTAIAHMRDKPYEHLEKLVDAVWETLIHRLKLHGLWQDKTKKRHFRWLLPKSLEHEPLWRLLLEDPLAVTSDMLRVMLDLQPATADDKPSPTEYVFYIRTFTIRPADLQHILQGMLHDGHDNNTRMFAWLERTGATNADDSDAYLTLRYIGQTKNKAWDRHLQDTYMKGLKTFMGHFNRQVGMDCKDVLRTATVDVISHATATVNLDPQTLDRREQMLIVLFVDGVLNTQVGGKDVIVLNEQDHHIFSVLRTNTIALLDKIDLPSQPLRSQLSAWSKRLQAYSVNNPTTRKGRSQIHVFSDNVRKVVLRQSLPRQLSDGSAVMVSLGSDIGDTHVEGQGTFFEAEGRSSYAINDIYNHFGHWEAGAASSSFNINMTKQLANDFKLPFADVIPFFVKHGHDYPEATSLTGDYINIVKPMIVTAYGALPTFAGMNNFNSFTKSDFESNGKGYSKGRWMRDVMGHPRLHNIKSDFHPDSGWFVLIPCCHPGLLGYVGALKDDLTRLLVMTLSLWRLAMTWVIEMDQDVDFQTVSRKEKCRTIIQQLNHVLSKHHEFGQAFSLAKENYMKSHRLWTESKALHKTDIRIGPPPRNLLPGKTVRLRRGYKVDEFETVDACSDLFEVYIDRYTTPVAPIPRDYRYRLTWTECGKDWSIAPVILPKDTLPKAYSNPASSSDKYYLCYTPGGIDIRNSAGKSLSTRQPLLNHQCRLETIPIASLVITLSEETSTNDFLSHWEVVACTSVEEALIETLPPGAYPAALKHTTSDPYYPKSFFDVSKTRRTMTFTAMVIGRQKSGVVYFDKAKTYLPANPADLLWLVDRFFSENFPKGGSVDLGASSIHQTSVYRLIAAFCACQMYKNHPHLKTLLAFASMAEMGHDCKRVPATALTAACELLRDSECPKNSKTANLKNGESSSRYVIPLNGNKQRPKKAISKFTDLEPEELERDLDIVEDNTDNESGSEGSTEEEEELSDSNDSSDSDDDPSRLDMGFPALNKDLPEYDEEHLNQDEEDSGLNESSHATGKVVARSNKTRTRTIGSESAYGKRKRDDFANDRITPAKKARVGATPSALSSTLRASAKVPEADAASTSKAPNPAKHVKNGTASVPKTTRTKVDKATPATGSQR